MTKAVAEPASAFSRSCFATAAALLSLAAPLHAQFGSAPKPVTVIKGGTVHVGNGDVIKDGIVVVRGSRIEAVGATISIPEGATVVDASGRHVYPGLIDAESSLMLDALARQGGEGNVTTSVVDALDPFETEGVEEALKAGVTTVGISTRRGIFDGTSAALKLKPGAARGDLVLRRDLAVTSTFGINGDRPSMRLRDWKTFADQLQATKKYVEAWDDYKEKLEEYKKELEKAKQAGDVKRPAEEPKKEAPAPGPDHPTPEGPPEGPGDRPGRRGRRRPQPPGGSLTPLLEQLAEIYRDGPQGGPPQQPPQQGGPQQGGGDKKDEGPKKPPRPGYEPPKEVLRRVLDGKLPLNVYVEHAADLENLLELAHQYHFRFVVTGGREASRMADTLAEEGVTVVVVQPNDLSSADLGNAAALDDAGVDVVLTTSGHSGPATRHLSLAAAAAVAGGMDSERALAAITSRPAALLGIADRVGTLEAGKDADVVITRGELFSSAAVVERVFIEGSPVAAR
jgi:imidazolonepropionase-like amidohydrolase